MPELDGLAKIAKTNRTFSIGQLEVRRLREQAGRVEPSAGEPVVMATGDEVKQQPDFLSLGNAV